MHYISVEMASIQPYMFQPKRQTAPSKEKSDKGGSKQNADDPQRKTHTNWCLCGKCAIMPSAVECLCCREIPEISLMLEQSDIHCVTLHRRFAAVCLDADVLSSVVVLLHDIQASTLEQPISNRYGF